MKHDHHIHHLSDINGVPIEPEAATRYDELLQELITDFWCTIPAAPRWTPGLIQAHLRSIGAPRWMRFKFWLKANITHRWADRITVSAGRGWTFTYEVQR